MAWQTELERWWDEGVPPDMFIYPDLIKADMQTLVGIVLDHVNGYTPYAGSLEPLDVPKERKRMAELRSTIEGLKNGKA